MAMDFLDHIIANRRANMIINAMDNSEYWKAQYQEMFDKYNNLVKEYNHDTARRAAERDYLIEVIQDNLDYLNISKDEINEKMHEASLKAAEDNPL